MESQNFDPYHRWLGIRPEEQPVDHYRLIGVARYESDADVIENACDQRMSHVRTFQSGKFRDHSQQVLNHLSTARGCLLNPENKQAYDATLQSAAPVAVAAVPTGEPVPATPQGPAIRSKPSKGIRRAPKRRGPNVGLLVGGGAVVLLLILGAVVGLMFVLKPNTPPVAQTPPANDSPSTIPPSTPIDKPAAAEPTDPPVEDPSSVDPTPDPMTPDPPSTTPPETDPPGPDPSDGNGPTLVSIRPPADAEPPALGPAGLDLLSLIDDSRDVTQGSATVFAAAPRPHNLAHPNPLRLGSPKENVRLRLAQDRQI